MSSRRAAESSSSFALRQDHGCGPGSDLSTIERNPVHSPPCRGFRMRRTAAHLITSKRGGQEDQRNLLPSPSSFFPTHCHTCLQCPSLDNTAFSLAGGMRVCVLELLLPHRLRSSYMVEDQSENTQHGFARHACPRDRFARMTELKNLQPRMRHDYMELGERMHPTSQTAMAPEGNTHVQANSVTLNADKSK